VKIFFKNFSVSLGMTEGIFQEKWKKYQKISKKA